MGQIKQLSVLAAAMMLAPVVSAMTDAEIEARFRKYEEQIQSLNAQIKDLKSSGGVVYVEDLEKQTERNTKQIDDIKAKMGSQSDKLKINGFMTAGVSNADDALDTPYELNDRSSFAGDGKAGIQFNYRMDEKTDATVQLVARSRGQYFNNSNDAWQTSAEWAYLGYQLTDDLKVRMGRLRTPFYMFSETLDVGYTQPWVRPPIEMYNLALTAYDGADLLYTFDMGSWNTVVQLYTGSSSSTNDRDERSFNTNVDIQDLYGLNITANNGPWTARAMATTLSIDGTVSQIVTGTMPAFAVPPGFTCEVDPVPNAFVGPVCKTGSYIKGPADETLDYYALGGQYDNGTVLLLSEVAQFDSKNAALFSDNVSGYLTGGYRIDRWMPYATYAFMYDDEKQSNLRVGAGAMQSYSLGVRRELTDSLDAKLEWNHFYDMENDGSFDGNPGDSTNVYTFTLDAVF